MRYTVGDGGFTSPELKDIDFSKKVVAMTCHRRENYGEPMKNIFSAVSTSFFVSYAVVNASSWFRFMAFLRRVRY